MDTSLTLQRQENSLLTKIGDDYTNLLMPYKFRPVRNGNFLEAYPIKKQKGWILYISVISKQFEELIQQLLPYLSLQENLSFKIPLHKTAAEQIYSGALGIENQGKMITIYCYNEQQLPIVAKNIIGLSKHYIGPKIPTALVLSGNVYVSYGGFVTIKQIQDSGIEEHYAYLNEEQLVKEPVTIPHHLPKNIKWPFDNSINLNKKTKQKILYGKYVIIHTLKHDPKGNVYKCLDISNWFNIRWCIIKEGRKNMVIDDFNRGIKERLLWQLKLHNQINKSVPTPTIYDYFEMEEDAYLVMEFIEGHSFFKEIDSKFNKTLWHCLEVPKKNKIITHLLVLIKTIAQLHELGIIHRDISPANFIIDKKGVIYMIDLELSYLLNNYPAPPFLLGTPGHISPEQLQQLTPTVKEDTFGLGALLLWSFANLTVTKFDYLEKERLFDQVYFFTQDKPLANLIVSCLHTDSEKRPTLLYILNTLHEFQDSTLLNQVKASKKEPDTLNDQAQTIDPIQLITGIAEKPFILQNAVWHSKRFQSNNKSNENDFKYQMGLETGIAGGLYLTEKFHKLIKPETKKNLVQENYHFLTTHFLSHLPDIAPDLLNGAAGIAIALAKCLESNLLSDHAEAKKWIGDCLLLETANLSLATGTAGSLLALLICQPSIRHEEYKRLLHLYTEKLLGHYFKEKKFKKYIQSNKLEETSFFDGLAGILYTLILYTQRENKQEWNEHIIAGIAFIIQKTPQTTTDHPDLSFKTGLSGIIRLLLKAYEVYKIPIHKEECYRLFALFPATPNLNDISFSNGMSGIGETFIEAYRVFRDPIWHEKATAIASIFANTSRITRKGTIYWYNLKDTCATIDLLSDNGGVFHFLLRQQKPFTYSFPIFN